MRVAGHNVAHKSVSDGAEGDEKREGEDQKGLHAGAHGPLVFHLMQKWVHPRLVLEADGAACFFYLAHQVRAVDLQIEQ